MRYGNESDKASKFINYVPTITRDAWERRAMSATAMRPNCVIDDGLDLIYQEETSGNCC